MEVSGGAIQASKLSSQQLLKSGKTGILQKDRLMKRNSTEVRNASAASIVGDTLVEINTNSVVGCSGTSVRTNIL